MAIDDDVWAKVIEEEGAGFGDDGGHPSIAGIWGDKGGPEGSTYQQLRDLGVSNPGNTPEGRRIIADLWGEWAAPVQPERLSSKGMQEMVIADVQHWGGPHKAASIIEQMGGIDAINAMPPDQAINTYSSLRTSLWPGNSATDPNHRLGREREWALSQHGESDGSHLSLSASIRESPYDLSKAISPASSQDYADPTPAEDKPHDILSPDSVTSRIKDQFPQYEKADGKEVYEKFVKRYQTPLEQLRALYPEYKDKEDSVFTEGIRKKYYPNESADDFKDRMTPPTGISGATKNFLKPLIPNLVKSWYQSTGSVAQKMQNIGQKNEEMQKAFTDSDAWINDRLGQITKALHAEGIGSALQESYGEIDKGFRETAAALFNWGKGQKEQGAAVQTPKPQGLAGNLGAIAGQAIGSAPEAAVTFLPNLTPTGAVLWAMTSAGVSTEAEAKEAKDPNSTVEGFVAGGAAGVMRWMMNNPRGWLISGLWNAAIGMGEEQAQRFLSGNKDNDLDKTAATGAVDFVLGALMGHGKERLPKAAAESIDKAFQARESGDIPKALELTDQAMLFLPDKQKAEVGQLLLKWRDDVIPMKDTPTPALPAPRAERATPTEPSGPVIRQSDSFKTRERMEFSDAPATGFKTSKGSTYTVNEDGTTTRNKSYHPEHGAKDQGLQPKSEKTIYLSKEDANKLSEFQTIGEGKAMQPLGDGRWGIKYTSGKDQGKFERRTVVTPQESPAAGLTPVEVWQGGKRVHFGNSITEVTKSEPAPKARGETSGAIKNPATLIHDAYKGLLKNQQGSAVFISDLARKTGMSISDLHSWIDKENRKGNLVLDVGHWPSATPEQRAAAIKQYGDQRLLVRFPELSDAAKDHVTDQFYSGFAGAPKAIGDFLIDVMPKVRKAGGKLAEATGVKKLGASWLEYWDPEQLGERQARTGAIISEQNALAATNVNRLTNLVFSRDVKEDRPLAQRETEQLFDVDLLDRKLRFSIYSERRDQFFSIRPDAELKKWAVDHEMGRSTGNAVADALEKKYDEILDQYGKRAQAAGLHFDLVDTYIPHILKKKGDMAKVSAYVRTRWGDPSFIKHRQVPTIAELHNLGIELQTYNPERYVQMYANMVEKAVAKIQALNNSVRAGDAVPAKDLKSYPKDFQAMVIAESSLVRSPAGDMYYVHKEADFMLHRAWDRNTIYDTPWGYPVKWANTVKQKIVGLRLGASGYHAFHELNIAIANDLATTTQEFMASKGTAADLLKALTNAVKSPRSIKPPGGYDQLIDFYNGDKGIGVMELTPENRQRRMYQAKGGLAPLISHEREQQFITHLSKVAPVPARVADKALDLGYKVLTVAPMQHLMFKKWIPSMKMYAYDQAVSGLFERKPELLRPENEMSQRVELRKLARDIDTRFGEMFYDNLFWPHEMKSIGQGLFTSLGWRIAEWRLYAGAAHHLLDNATHADELIKQARAEGVKPVAQRVLTNSVLYGFWYHATTFIQNALITAAFGGGVITIKDLVYPRIGKDKDGKDKRLKMPYFQTDIYSLGHHMHDEGVIQGTLNDYKYKLQGDLVDWYDVLASNKDYRGTQIRDPHGTFAEQSAQVAAHVLAQHLPISVENYLAPKPGGDWRDQLFPFLGMPAAPSWASQSGIDNDIFHRFLMHQPQEKAHIVQEKSDAWNHYRAAIENKNAHGMLEARKELSRLHISDKSMDKFTDSMRDPKQRSMSAGKSVLKKLDPLEQEQILKGMTPDERKEYLQYASPEVRKWLEK